MKKKKRDYINYMIQFGCITITTVICYVIYKWGENYPKALNAVSLGMVAYLFICFFCIIFHGNQKGMMVRIISALTVLAFANQLYDYQKLIAIFPALGNVDKLIVYLIILGFFLIFLIVVRIMMYLYENADDGTPGEGIVSGMDMHSKVNASKDKTGWMFIYLLILILVVAGGGALFSVLFNNGFLAKKYDFFAVLTTLMNYVGSAIMIFLALVVVIIFMIEMVRLIISRMKMFAVTLRDEAKADVFPLYAISVVVDMFIVYLTYKLTGVSMDTFYNFVSDGKIFALPLMFLFTGIVFLIIMRITYATLVLLIDMKPENVKRFFKDINANTRISGRVVEIIKITVDLILDTIICAFKFASFISIGLFNLYNLVIVFEDEEDEDESVDIGINIDDALSGFCRRHN